MPALHSISFDPPSALGSLVLLSSEECLRACRATRDCATFAVMLHSPCRMPCRLFSSNASARGTSGSAAGDAKMHIRGPHAKRLTETVRNIASRRRREVIRAAARTAEKPRICWEALPAQTLLVHSQQPRRDRCAFRRRTWREAVSLCLTTPWCGGLTRDHGMHCGEEMRLLRYELRLGVVEAMSPRLVQRLVRGVPANKWMVDMLTVSWLIRSVPCGRNRTNASLNGHQWAPPRDHELNTSYRSSSHDALTADQRRKAYLQSHWHPGMEEVDSCLRMRRLGNAGDGGKMVCFDEGIRPDARWPLMAATTFRGEHHRHGKGAAASSLWARATTSHLRKRCCGECRSARSMYLMGPTLRADSRRRCLPSCDSIGRTSTGPAGYASSTPQSIYSRWIAKGANIQVCIAAILSPPPTRPSPLEATAALSVRCVHEGGDAQVWVWVCGWCI